MQSSSSVELSTILWRTIGVEDCILEFNDPLSEHVDLSNELILSPVHLPESFVHFIMELPDIQKTVPALLEFSLIPFDPSELIDCIKEFPLMVS